MAVIDVTAAKVRPLNGAVVRRYRLGAAANVGDGVYIASDGDVEPVDADAQASAQGRGVVVAIGARGKTAGAAGDVADVVVHGPVELGNETAMTPGASVYGSPTAGKLDQTASATSGDYNAILGYAETSTILFVDPQVTAPVVVP